MFRSGLPLRVEGQELGLERLLSVIEPQDLDLVVALGSRLAIEGEDEIAVEAVHDHARGEKRGELAGLARVGEEVALQIFRREPGEQGLDGLGGVRAGDLGVNPFGRELLRSRGPAIRDVTQS